jgi:zinc protease
LSLAKVTAFYGDFYGAGNAEFAAVGDFDADATRTLLNKLFGDWKAAQPYARVPEPVYSVAPTQLKFETPDKANAVFNAQLRFPLQDTDADYPALLVANHMLGGGPSSRLWARIRDKEGLSYGVGSGIGVSSFEPSASWTARAIYAPQNLARFERAFREEVERALRDGFTADELKDAKNGLLQTRRLARAQDGGLAAALANQLELDRTSAFAAEVDRKIAALSLNEANAA